MKHKGCGGAIEEDQLSVPYRSFHPVLLCLKCGQEIVGDAQIELDGDDE